MSEHDEASSPCANRNRGYGAEVAERRETICSASHLPLPSSAPYWQNLTKGQQAKEPLKCDLQRQLLHHRWKCGKKARWRLSDCRWTTSKSLSLSLFLLASLLYNVSRHCRHRKLQILVSGCLSSVFLLGLIGSFFLSNLIFPSLALSPPSLPPFIFSLFLSINSLSLFFPSVVCWVSIDFRLLFIKWQGNHPSKEKPLAANKPKRKQSIFRLT